MVICAVGLNGKWTLKLSVPANTSVVEKDDEGKEGGDPQPLMELTFGTGASARMFTTERIEVALDRIDPPGGRIEGKIDGTVIDRRRGSAVITVTGSFSVVRGGDRIIE